MTTSQFDVVTNTFFTTEIVGETYCQRISGPGYFIIINPDSKYVSFSKSRHDICFGDIVSDIIKEYTNEQYANDYGSKRISYPADSIIDRMPAYDRVRVKDGYISKTVLEYMRENCRMNIPAIPLISEMSHDDYYQMRDDVSEDIKAMADTPFYERDEETSL